MSKPILVLDFDGVIHSYTSRWKGADVIPDPPVPGAMKFIWDASEHFTIAIFSSRSHQPGGIKAMQGYLDKHMREYLARTDSDVMTNVVLSKIQWPTEKPPTFLTIDDRAIMFEGIWPNIDGMLKFKPWNKRGEIGNAN